METTEHETHKERIKELKRILKDKNAKRKEMVNNDIEQFYNEYIKEKLESHVKYDNSEKYRQFYATTLKLNHKEMNKLKKYLRSLDLKVVHYQDYMYLRDWEHLKVYLT